MVVSVKRGLATFSLGLLCLSASVTRALSQPPAPSWAAWVPNGWKVIKVARGNLTGSPVAAAIVIEEKSRRNIRKNDAMGSAQLNLNPRTLLLLAKTPDGYREITRSARFLPSEDSAESPCLSDPLMEGGNVEFSGGNLVITLEDFMSCGGWDVTNTRYRFRLEGRRLRLIGKDVVVTSRATLEETITSQNYLTRRAQITTGLTAAEGQKSKPKIEQKLLPVSKPQYIDTMKSDEHD